MDLSLCEDMNLMIILRQMHGGEYLEWIDFRHWRYEKMNEWIEHDGKTDFESDLNGLLQVLRHIENIPVLLKKCDGMDDSL